MLLQNDKAIFYHPCDDSTESLKSQAWTESTTIYGAGKVSDALGATVGATFAAEHEFQNRTTTGISAAALSATKFVVVYFDVTFNVNRVKVGTVSGTDITYSPETAGYASGAALSSVAALSATGFVVAYVDQLDSNKGKAKVGTVSGTDVTFGAEATFINGSTGEISAAALSASKFVVAYRDNIFIRGAAQVGTVSGTDITFGSAVAFLTPAATDISATALSATKIVVAYTDNGDSSGNTRVGTVSGADITFGAETEFTATSGGQAVAALDPAKVILAYVEGPSDKAMVGTVSGTDITFGAPATVGTAGVDTVLALSATRFVIVSGTAASAASVSGTVVTTGAPPESFVGSGSSVSAAALSATEFVVAYRDLGDSSRGKANVGMVSSAASLTASTPAAYDTAAAATKVGFVGWLRNPSA